MAGAWSASICRVADVQSGSDVGGVAEPVPAVDSNDVAPTTGAVGSESCEYVTGELKESPCGMCGALDSPEGSVSGAAGDSSAGDSSEVEAWPGLSAAGSCGSVMVTVCPSVLKKPCDFHV